MTIVHPDWISGLLGGLMIGLAGAIFLLGNGRIMGASGILGRVLDRSETQPMVENIVFLLALVLAPVVFSQWFATGPTHLSDNWLVIISAGLLWALERALPMAAPLATGFAVSRGFRRGGLFQPFSISQPAGPQLRCCAIFGG